MIDSRIHIISRKRVFNDKKILTNHIYIYKIYDRQICSLLQTIDINLHVIISICTLYV